MAIYRLHRKQWEKAYSTVSMHVRRQHATIQDSPSTSKDASAGSQGKRKRKSGLGLEAEHDSDDSARTESPTKSKRVKTIVHASGAVQKKGVSTGLTVVTKGGKKDTGKKGRSDWWKEFGGGGSKGGVNIPTRAM